MHLGDQDVLISFVLGTLEIPDAFLMTLDMASLPSHWQDSPAPSDLAAIGDEWLHSKASLGLLVPSTLVPQQQNILLNPAHKDFAQLASSATASPFRFDPRLLKR